MLLIIFLTNARVAFLNNLELIRQSFISEHALLEQEIAERKNTFHNILTGMDIMLTEQSKHHNTQVHLPKGNVSLTLYKPVKLNVPRAFFLPEDLQSQRAEISLFMDLARWAARFMAKDDTMKTGEVISGYLYHSRHGIIDIIDDHDAIEHKSELFNIEALAEELDHIHPGADYLNHKPLSERIVWLPPQREGKSGREMLRLAAPVMLGNDSLAMLVMSFPAPTLAPPSLTSELPGRLHIEAPNGKPIDAGDRNSIPAALIAAGLTQERTEHVFKSGLIFTERLGDTGWVLLFQCSWLEIAALIGRQIGEVALATLGLLILLWYSLIYFKMRIFRPLINHSHLVYESEQLSRTLIDTAPLGLGILNVDSRAFLLCSPMMQHTEEQLKADEGTLADKLMQSYSRHTDAGNSQEEHGLAQFEQTLEMIDGQQLSLAVSMTPSRYHGDEVLVVAFTDITNKKRLENQLMAAREAADKASAAKSAFLAAMSHEIRTPLNAILGNLELLSRSVPTTQRDRLNIIQRASDNLLLTISDILDFSKIEAGELHLEDVEFDLFAVAADILAIYTPLARAKGIFLSGEIGHTATQLMRGDPTSLRQILNNLLANALKFTEKGYIKLRITVLEASSSVNIYVEDTGIGMTQVQLRQVFHPFRQADETINRRYGGTGLGLALCTGLVKAMSGKLSTRSQIGKGSAFRVSLPLGTGMVCAEPPRFSPVPVTLVSSDPHSRSWLSEVMHRWGLIVTAYQHPAQIGQITEPLHTLVIWGDRSTWHPLDEKRLINCTRNVIDCRDDGPDIPTINGQVITTSVRGLIGLSTSLACCLQQQMLPVRAEEQASLTNVLRVLVVEDNPVNQQLFKEQLKLLGCHSVIAKEGEEALVCLRQQTFDIVLTDLSMPGMDGYALAERIRDRWPTLPVVAITANVTQQEYEECSAVSIVRVLTKPLLLRELEQTLLEVCHPDKVSHTPAVVQKDTVLGLTSDAPLPDEVRQLFEQTSAESVAMIREAMQACNQAVILRELHSLKGAFAVFGLKDLMAQTVEISEQIKHAGIIPARYSLTLFCEELEKGGGTP